MKHRVDRIVVVGALALALAIGGGTACSVGAEQLKSQPLAYTQSVESTRQTNRKFLIQTFEDLRGGEYGYIYPTSFIPVIDFFHIGEYSRYPEQSGLLRSSRGGRPTVTVGALDSAMPYLLAETIRRMKKKR